MQTAAEIRMRLELFDAWLVPRLEKLQANLNTQIMWASGPFVRAMLWETTESKKWTGRDWRRVKRERRKFLAKTF